MKIEFENLIRTFSFLNCLLDIQIAWINAVLDITFNEEVVKLSVPSKITIL